jgi:hypothetical protein
MRRRGADAWDELQFELRDALRRLRRARRRARQPDEDEAD